MNVHPAITVSRTLASGGSLVAYHLAQRLGWRYCDRAILRQVTQEMGIPLSRLRYQEERPLGMLEILLNLAAVASPEVPYAPPLELPVYSTELFREERRVMERILEQSPAILVGRGGFVAFKDRPNTLHVHVQASLEFRIQRLLKIGKAASPAEARQLIEASDKARCAFIREISGREWLAPGNFHVMADPSTDGFEACEARILESLRGETPTNVP